MTDPSIENQHILLLARKAKLQEEIVSIDKAITECNAIIRYLSTIPDNVSEEATEVTQDNSGEQHV